MITEDYVSFETAKLLKEKGFDEYGMYFYTLEDEGMEGYKSNKRIQELAHNSHPELEKRAVSCPTLQMAVKWVQEAHNIIIIPNYEYECDSTPWCYKIFKLGENGKPERVAVKGVSYDKDNNPTEHVVGYRDYERSHKDYSTKEEAIEEGIKYCLENLI